MTDLRALTKRPMRWAAVPAAVVVALPTVALAPAQAEVTWSGCDTDRFKATAKYKGKVELTIIQRAKGCMEYHTLSDGRTCGVLTSYETSHAVEVKLGRAKQVRKWGPVVNSLPEKIQTDCNSLGENTGLFTVKEKFTGRYKIDLKAQKDPHAVPGLTVTISAANGQDGAESIVDTRKTGSWKFSKDNNKSKTKPTDKKKNKKPKNPSPDNSEPTPSTPLIPNGGSM